jgi:hypothetical protein
VIIAAWRGKFQCLREDQRVNVNAPTTFLVDGEGHVRWLARPKRFIARRLPVELLAAINETWP